MASHVLAKWSGYARDGRAIQLDLRISDQDGVPVTATDLPNRLPGLYAVVTPAPPVDEVMRTGHVGAEYVEYVLRHKRGMRPAPPPLRLGVPALDDIAFREADLSLYDHFARPHKTLDPGDPPQTATDHHHAGDEP